MLCVRGRWSDRLAAEIRAGTKNVLPRSLHRSCSLRTEWLGHGLHDLQRGRCCSYPYAPEDEGPKSASQNQGIQRPFQLAAAESGCEAILRVNLAKPQSKARAGTARVGVCQVAVRLSGTHFPRGY